MLGEVINEGGVGGFDCMVTSLGAPDGSNIVVFRPGKRMKGMGYEYEVEGEALGGTGVIMGGGRELGSGQLRADGRVQ